MTENLQKAKFLNAEAPKPWIIFDKKQKDKIINNDYIAVLFQYKYFILYAIIGSLFFGLIFGFIAALIGLFCDYGIRYIDKSSIAYAANNKEYAKYLYSYRIQSRIDFSLEMFCALSVTACIYYILLSIGGNIDLFRGAIDKWYEITSPFAYRMSDFVPAINKFERLLIGKDELSLAAKTKHMLSIAWAVVFLGLIFFFSNLVHFIKPFSCDITNVDWHFRRAPLIMQFIRLGLFFAGTYMFFRISFPTNILESYETTLPNDFFLLLSVLSFSALLMYSILSLIILSNFIYKNFNR